MDQVGSDETAFEKLLEDLNDGVCIFKDEVRLFVNEEYVRQHGLESVQASLESPTASEVDAQKSRDWRAMKDRLNELSPYRYQMRQPDGSWKTLEASYTKTSFRGATAWASVTRDVTPSVEARHRLEEQDQLFRRLFQSAPVGMALTGSDRRITQANPALAEMLGVRVEDMLGKQLSGFERDRAARGSIGDYDRLISGELETFVIDRELARADGSPVWTETISSAVTDDDGQFLYAVRIVNDVSTRRHLEVAENRFRLLVKNAPVGIILGDIHHTIIEANDALCQMLGRPLSEIVGKRLSAFERDRAARGHTGNYETLLSGEVETVVVDRELVGADGETVWAETITAALRDDRGQFVYSVRIVNDVSARHHLEVAESRFRRLFEDAPVGIILADSEDEVIQANAALCRMLGRPLSEILGKRLSAFERNPESRSRQEEFEQVIAGTLESFTMDREWVRPNGQSVWTETITSAVRDEHGAFLYALRIINDVTERVAMERAQSEFIAMTSHELRTPLTVIHAAVSLLADGKADGSVEKVQELMGLAERNTTRMIRVVNDLLDLQRLGAGRFALAPRQCDGGEIAREVIDSMLLLANLSSEDIALEFEPALFSADRDRVIQVLSNLVGNAVKFARNENPVRVRVSKREKAVRFAVSDSGPGIPESELEAIFDRFHQVVGGDDRLPGGWGLGLAIAKAIVDEHGGNIWAESVVGVGSTFSFELPTEFGSGQTNVMAPGERT